MKLLKAGSFGEKRISNTSLSSSPTSSSSSSPTSHGSSSFISISGSPNMTPCSSSSIQGSEIWQ